MITPDFSGQRVPSVPEFHKTVDIHKDHRATEEPYHTSESRRHVYHHKSRHLLIEKHGHERHLQEEISPHTRRREIQNNLQGQSLSSTTKQHIFDFAQELHNVNKTLALCYDELKHSKYMKEIVREIEVENTVNSDNLIALKDLFQQLMKEMVHIQSLLSHYNNITNVNQVDFHEKPVNNTVSTIPGPNDLVHLKGPITENTITATLQARFNTSCYHTKIGPVHLMVNAFDSSEQTEASGDTNHKPKRSQYIKSLVGRSLEKLFETQMPQTLILSGECGSGKSYAMRMLIQELTRMSCGTAQADLVKQLYASLTVLDSFGKARTMNNVESSRVAILYEFHINNEVIYKTKIRCIPLSVSRIVEPREDESSFRIFYQMFAGLNPKDRANLQLQTHSAHELRFLYNYPSGDQSEIERLRNQFQSWKSALQILGIPFSDVTKVLAAILLLGNVEFTEKSPRILEVQGGDFELKAVAALLGVPYTSLFRGLTKKSKIKKAQDTTLQSCSATQANYNRDALAKTLYLRVLSAIVRRCNCPRKSTSSTECQSPSSSRESLSHDRLAHENRNQEIESVVSPNFDGQVLGIADLFGFDNNCQCNRMEQICANLCAETIQHFYTTHIFKSAEGYCREEGIENEVDVDYVDNSQCIELLTCQETGVLTYLDHETLKNGTTENFVEKLGAKHVEHQKFFTTNCGSREFGIAHHSAKVIYDADELLRGNDDSIADDVTQIFSSEQCNFGFVVHLFASDLKSLKPQKDGVGMEEEETDGRSSSLRTFSQEFQAELDKLLKTLIHADPWFILCLKSNLSGSPCQFDPEVVTRQIKSLQIFETVHLLRSGYTHRMRLIPFAQRYFVHDDQLTQNDALEIAQSYQKMLCEGKRENPCKIFYIGRKHVFFSEILWQDLERSRPKRHLSQHLRKNSFDITDALSSKEHHIGKEDISPISRNEPLETTHSRAENELSTPPAIPKRRGYTVIDNKKIAFPQMRVMTDDYRDTVNGQDVVFNSGESIKVTGVSPKAGYLAVESRHKNGWVPYKLTKLMTDDVI